MDLLSAGLHGYQRFEQDFGEMDLTGSPVAIVGPNEAGKTSFLEALEHLNDGSPFLIRNRTRGYQGNTEVRARFALDGDDRESIRKVGGVGQPVLLIVSRRSGSDELLYQLQPPMQRDLEPRRKAHAGVQRVRNSKWLSSRDADDETQESLDNVLEILELTAQDLTERQLDGITETANHLEGLEDASPAAKRLIARLRTLRDVEARTHPNEAAAEILLSRRPRFLLFDTEWLQLESQFDFPNGPSDAVRALFDLIDFDLSTLEAAIESSDATGVADLTADANVAFAGLFTGRWSTANVRVEIDVNGNTMHIFVRTAAGRLVPMADRSAGLRQFIALLAFVEHKRREGERVVLLVDEADNHLHYDAQADLVNIFTRQVVVDKIIYTTHSAGCLPRDLGTGVRVVEPVGPQGTPPEEWDRSKIRNAFWTTGPGFSPLLLAMGASSFAFSALRRAVIGEGPTEVILLPTLLREATGLPTLEFQVVPGVANVRPDAVLELAASAVRVVYIVDGDLGGLAHREKLIDADAPEDRILTLGEGVVQGLTIEDVVDPALFLDAVNRVLEFYGRVPCPPEQIPDVGRKAAVEAWCQQHNEESPGEREVAQQILEIAGEHRRREGVEVLVIDEARTEVMVQTHTRLEDLLG